MFLTALSTSPFASIYLKGQMNQKIEIISFVALPSPKLKRTILSEIWVKIFLPKPL